VSLVARHLEAAGLPTVVIGSGRDIVEQCGVPRFLFVDYPLGNPCGKPNDVDDQRHIVGLGLDLLEQAFVPRTTVQAPVLWSDDHRWRDDFMAVTPELEAQLRAAGAARRTKQAANKQKFEADQEGQ